MKEKVIILKPGHISREDMMKNIADNDGECCYFMIETDWNRTTYAHLNNVVEDSVEDGHLLGDIDYNVVELSKDKSELIIMVSCYEVEDYVNEDG